MASASEVIRDLPHQLNGQKISVSDVLDKMNGRSLLLTILILIVPNLIPFVNALGITQITGILLLIFTLRLTIGIHRLWLPKWLQNITTDKNQIRDIADKAVPWFEAMEKFAKPRATQLVRKETHFIYAFLLLSMTIVMLLPIPFVNVIPAAIMTLITLGLIQRDGIVASFGAILAIALLFGLSYVVNIVGSDIFTDSGDFFEYQSFKLVNF